jgi:hypothetical protein
MEPNAYRSRRDLLKLMGLGGVVFASGLARGLTACSSSGSGSGSGTPRGATEDFFFLQLSDTHYGFSGPMVNPQAGTMLKDTVAVINSVAMKPDFVIFTGDLIHDDMTTDEPTRLSRMMDFKGIVSGITGTMLKFLPGEHDAAADQGMAFKQVFLDGGDLHYSFDNKGIHFVVLDNVSSPTATLGDAQLAWLSADLAPHDSETPIVVFAHRPLFPLYPQWDWTTDDGQKAIDILSAYANVTVFYGHIHQEIDTMTGHIPHHSARSLMFPFPAAGSQPMRTPIPWDPQNPGKGLGYRTVDAGVMPASYQVTDFPPGLSGV